MPPTARPRRLKPNRNTRAQIGDLLAMISGQLQGIIIALDNDNVSDEVKEASVTDEVDILKTHIARLESVVERHFAHVPPTGQGELL